jgi:2-methylisocitrate lyase-like PEP mutase family enzyme
MTNLATTFRHLHDGPDLLLLANCWDAGSARLIESLGARAIATTSAGVAWSNGYPDGAALPVDRLIASVRAIARVIAVPLTVDIENGYSDDPAAVADTIAAVIEAGAVGINIEDGRGAPELLAAKIARARATAARLGVDLFVNVRTDVYLKGLVPGPARVAETLARAQLYRDAGADGLFVPLAVDAAEIRELASAARLPLNLLACPGLAGPAELAGLGVRRLSAGSAIPQSLWTRTASMVRDFFADGRSEPLCAETTPWVEINALFPAR